MSAEIENFVRANGTLPAWHGLGGTIDPNASIEAWQEAAGMDWEVNQSPVFYNVDGKPLVDKSKRVFYRSDKPETVLGVMSDQFKPVQPKEALQFFDALQNELDISLDTAGVLKGGSKYWALAKNNKTTEPMPGDVIDDYLLVATANDGTMSTRIGPCRVRVVCQNTLTAAISQSTGLLTVNHRQKIDWKRARNWIMKENEDFTLFGDLMAELVKIPVNTEQAAKFSYDLMTPDWDGKGKAPRKLVKFMETLQHGVGQREAGQTAYGLINAATRYADHDKQSRSDENRLNSAWFGQGATLKQQAMDLLIADCVNAWGHKDQLVPVLSETKWADKLAA